MRREVLGFQTYNSLGMEMVHFRLLYHPIWERTFHVTVAVAVFSGVLFCVPNGVGVLGGIWNRTASVPENFPTYV